MTASLGLLLLTTALLEAPAAVASAAAAPYRQQEYVVSGCLDPPLDDSSYVSLKTLNFTGIFGERTATTPRAAAAQAALCQKHGLTSCFPGHAAADSVPLNGSVRGYYLKDEPHMWDFGQWASQAKAIRKKRPGALVFINMLGSDRTTFEGEDIVPMRGWWGCGSGKPPPKCSYKQYVDRFISEMQPDILCFDQYPNWGDCESSRLNMNATYDTTEHFLYNLAYINNRSLGANLSFWNYFKSGFGVEVCGPSEGKVAWQMYASALHGSRGLLHFLVTPCATPVDCGDVPHPPHAAAHGLLQRGGMMRKALGATSDSSLGRKDHGYPGLLTPEGAPAPGPIYDISRRLNSIFRAWGPTLMGLRTPAGGQVYLRFADGAQGMGRKLAAANAPLVNISLGDYNVGMFYNETRSFGSAPDGNQITAIMLQNNDAANFRFATVVWRGSSTPSGDIGKVMEVDGSDGRAKPVQDAATHVAGFQVVLNAGEAKLYSFV